MAVSAGFSLTIVGLWHGCTTGGAGAGSVGSLSPAGNRVTWPQMGAADQKSFASTRRDSLFMGPTREVLDAPLIMPMMDETPLLQANGTQLLASDYLVLFPPSFYNAVRFRPSTVLPKAKAGGRIEEQGIRIGRPGRQGPSMSRRGGAARWRAMMPRSIRSRHMPLLRCAVSRRIPSLWWWWRS